MKTRKREQGFTLIELLVAIAILGIVLAGIYGMIDAAYETYNNTRARIESQQTARIVMDYLAYRLREIDGSTSVDDPTQCIDCHEIQQDNDPTKDHDDIPCEKDVSVPRKGLYLDTLSTIAFTPLDGVPLAYQNMSGNYIKFKADLLPVVGFPDSFTDANGNGEWDFNDDGEGAFGGNGEYDPGETELLDDMNDNSQYDYYGETWTLELRKAEGDDYYQLVESLDFSSLQPDDNYNRSTYENYTAKPVAYGLVGMSIKRVPRQFLGGRDVDETCMQSADEPMKCHGANADEARLNIYDSATSFNIEQFKKTHPWWDVRGFSVEVSTIATKSVKQDPHLVKMKQFIIPRNMEVNK